MNGRASRSARDNRAVPKTTRELPGPPLDPEADARSRKRARVWWWVTGLIVVGVVLWVLVTGGESDRGNEITLPRDFCRAAGRYERTAERQKADGHLTKEEISRQAELVVAVVDTAPPRLRADAETFLTALQRADVAGKQIEVSAAEQDAVENVNRSYAQGCAVYKRDGL